MPLLKEIATLSLDLSKMMDSFMNHLEASQDVTHEHLVMWTKIGAVYVNLHNKVVKAKSIIAAWDKDSKKQKVKDKIALVKKTFAILEAEFHQLETLRNDLLEIVAEFGPQ
jgi:hypothetical protein